MSVSLSRRRATSSIVALLFISTFVPTAAAQERHAPAPQELWRQFPLDDARTGQPPTSEAPRRVERPTRESPSEARQSASDNLSLLGLAAIALATLVVIALAGLLAAVRPQSRNGRGRTPYAPAPQSTDSGGSADAAFSRRTRRGKQMDELEILKFKREADRRAAKTSASSVDDVEVLRAKLFDPAARIKETTTTREDLEILKSKRDSAASAANSNSTRSESVDALKRKLDSSSAANGEKPERQRFEPVRTKLARRADSPDTPSPDAKKPRAKLDLVPGTPGPELRAAPTPTPGGFVDRPPTNRVARKPRGAAAVAPVSLPLGELKESVESLPRVRCRVALWRGYIKSQFYAIEHSATQAPRVVAESPLFRIRGGGLPSQEGAISAAHAALIAKLEQDGWCVVARGPRWFNVELERVVNRTRQDRRVR